MNQSEVKQIIEVFREAGQAHVFSYFDKLDKAAQECLLNQAALIDLKELETLVIEHVKGTRTEQQVFDEIRPAPYIKLPGSGGDRAEWEKAFKVGAAAITENRVAAFTVAGGQGTRLGYDGPKGTFPVTPVLNKTLFQVFAEKIARSKKRFGANIPWFVLTSEINHEATLSAFKEYNYWGLDPDSVHFVVQGLVPAVDHAGKLLMAEKSKIAMTPDGHGGSLRALVRSGAITKMAAMGVDIISYFQVDNPLVHCIDPAFVGFHILEQSEVSSKMVPKAYSGEKVGVFCKQGTGVKVIEYSDLSDEMQNEKDADGTLRFNAGSIAIHVFDREFVERIAGSKSEDQLPFHRADKKVSSLNAEGRVVEPDVPNGIKFEMFVFDTLPLAQNPIVIETSRQDEFSPVKNADGADSPATSCDDQLRMFARWLLAAGEQIETDETGLPGINFEISPLFANDEADFVLQWSLLSPKPSIVEGSVIE